MCSPVVLIKNSGIQGVPLEEKMAIRKCTDSDFDAIHEIINDAAEAYRGVIPEDCWHDPYMSREELKREIQDGICFWGVEDGGVLKGVMGIQAREDVDLIRHAYVRTADRRQGIGTELLRFLQSRTEKPILIGTWADAAWAIRFYQKHGYRVLSQEETNRLLRKYWTIPERQVETSVVLASAGWNQPIRSGDRSTRG
jgi:GNAT superfamily N-acetyltransferase